MPALLTIGEFSRATYLTVKTLRHYHDVGLLEPAQVDGSSGYGYYRADQIATAQTIRRLRELDMPVEQVKGVLQAADAGERDALIAAHLERMEQQLERTTAAVASLRALLQEPEDAIAVEFRAVPPTPALSVSAVVSLDALVSWWTAAFDELTSTLAAKGLRPAGNSGALYTQEVFEQAHGEVVVFVPVAERVTAAGRARPLTIPAAELGRYLAEHDLKAEEPVREYYLVGPRHTEDANQWQTEIAWPVARTDAFRPDPFPQPRLAQRPRSSTRQPRTATR
jgi:DNA-binding transcriptional MerR regulator